MRKYIRHPMDIPIEVVFQGESSKNDLNNLGLGGLSFYTHQVYRAGDIVTIKILLVSPAFEVATKVVWCQAQTQGGYDIGVEFISNEDIFKARMVEQICHIEHYKKEVLEKEGRNLDGRQAALEWIEKYAADFPVFS